MFLDALTLLSDAQAFPGAATVSTNTLDLGLAAPNAREVGTGEPLVVGFATDVAAGAGSTLVLEVLQSANADLSAPDVIASFTDIAANMTAGRLGSIGIPAGYPKKRYLGARATLTGGTTTATLTIWVAPWSMFSLLAKAYAKNYVS